MHKLRDISDVKIARNHKWSLLPLPPAPSAQLPEPPDWLNHEWSMC